MFSTRLFFFSGCVFACFCGCRQVSGTMLLSKLGSFSPSVDLPAKFHLQQQGNRVSDGSTPGRNVFCDPSREQMNRFIAAHLSDTGTTAGRAQLVARPLDPTGHVRHAAPAIEPPSSRHQAVNTHVLVTSIKQISGLTNLLKCTQPIASEAPCLHIATACTG